MSNASIKELWSHISKTMTSKSNDPFEDLWATVIPVKADGSFGEYIMVDPEEYDDAYEFIRHLSHNTERFETSQFGFMTPAWKRDPETGERVGQTIQFILVTSYHTCEFGMWDLTDNELNFLDSEQAANASLSGELPVALMGLSLGIAIEKGELGEAGELMLKAKKMILEAQEISEKAFAMLNTKG
jgi:hypothetical protein